MSNETPEDKSKASSDHATEAKADAPAPAAAAEHKDDAHGAPAAADGHGDGHDDGHGDPHGDPHGAPKGPSKVAAIIGALKELPRKLIAAAKGQAGAVRDILKGLLDFPKLIIHGDLTTRILAFGFLTSVVLLIVTGSKLLVKVGPKPTVHHEPVKTAEEIEAEKKEHEAKQLEILSENIVFLEQFTANLAAKGDERPQAIELEFYVEADSPETAGFVRAHVAELRDVATSTIQHQEYDELLSEEGKNKLKGQLLDAINKAVKKWAPEGSIKRVHFTQLNMG